MCVYIAEEVIGGVRGGSRRAQLCAEAQAGWVRPLTDWRDRGQFSAGQRSGVRTAAGRSTVSGWWGIKYMRHMYLCADFVFRFPLSHTNAHKLITVTNRHILLGEFLATT